MGFNPIGFIGSVLNSAVDVGKNQLENKWNTERAHKYWLKQQEYNTPSNQMKRLRKAGINPHLAFSQGSINNVATSPPQVGMGQGAPFGAIQDMAMMAQTEQTKQQTKTEKVRTAIAKVEKTLNELKVPTAHFQSVMDTDRMQAYIQMPRNERYDMLAEEIVSGIKETNRREVGLKLKNEYQTELNRMAENNLRPGSNDYVLLTEAILRYLGVEVQEGQ